MSKTAGSSRWLRGENSNKALGFQGIPEFQANAYPMTDPNGAGILMLTSRVFLLMVNNVNMLPYIAAPLGSPMGIWLGIHHDLSTSIPWEDLKTHPFGQRISFPKTDCPETNQWVVLLLRYPLYITLRFLGQTPTSIVQGKHNLTCSILVQPRRGSRAIGPLQTSPQIANHPDAETKPSHPCGDV